MFQAGSGDLQFLTNRKFSCTEICWAFGVPEEIITTTEKAKYDVMGGAAFEFHWSRVQGAVRAKSDYLSTVAEYNKAQYAIRRAVGSR